MEHGAGGGKVVLIGVKLDHLLCGVLLGQKLMMKLKYKRVFLLTPVRVYPCREPEASAFRFEPLLKTDD